MSGLPLVAEEFEDDEKDEKPQRFSGFLIEGRYANERLDAWEKYHNAVVYKLEAKIIKLEKDLDWHEKYGHMKCAE